MLGGSRTGTLGVQRILSSTQPACVTEEPPLLTTQQLVDSTVEQPSMVVAVAEPVVVSSSQLCASDLPVNLDNSVDVQSSDVTPNMTFLNGQSENEAQSAGCAAAVENMTSFVDDTSSVLEHGQTEALCIDAQSVEGGQHKVANQHSMVTREKSDSFYLLSFGLILSQSTLPFV
ncbi:hypothetical protein V6N11_016322 [Hibiscus sabdariffa]|uniref:Uncharacterized protein n=1 Tax=Hibiscus sabdariffa TaxID=183260 RepID=A0ABR2TV25_9ROSI